MADILTSPQPTSAPSSAGDDVVFEQRPTPAREPVATVETIGFTESVTNLISQPASTVGEEAIAAGIEAEQLRAQIEDGNAIIAGVPSEIDPAEFGDQGLTGPGFDADQLQENIFEVRRQRDINANDEQLAAERQNLADEVSIYDEFPPPVPREGIPDSYTLDDLNNEQPISEPSPDAVRLVESARKVAPKEASINWKTKNDWRVRLSLAPESDYFYKATDPGILAPLRDTDGVLFPYVPSVSVSYVANYNSDDVTHNNYTYYSYRSSSVNNVSISCEFTAQDTYEANYLLAVIHFFRSMTKMFYGKDQNPKLGTPPPLCYLFGFGEFQFNGHPLVINSFSYNTPTDVDYIRTNSQRFLPGVNQQDMKSKNNSPSNRLGNTVSAGGNPIPPRFTSMQTGENITYVPTLVSLSIGAFPIMSRNDISNKFSLTDYATGKLLQGTKNRSGGFW